MYPTLSFRKGNTTEYSDSFPRLAVVNVILKLLSGLPDFEKIALYSGMFAILHEDLQTVQNRKVSSYSRSLAN